MLFSSGDWGVGGGDCQTNDGRNVTHFQPIFPASCKPSPIYMYLVFGWRLTRLSGPFVTAVGGTTSIKPETAISLTGGGFSNYFSRPSYQDKDVTAYIKNLNGTYDGLYKCGFCLLAFDEPSQRSVRSITVLRAVDSRMLRLVLTGTEWSLAARLIMSREPVPALQCVIHKTNLFHPSNWLYRPALDHGRISLTVERLQNRARPLFARVPQPIFVF